MSVSKALIIASLISSFVSNGNELTERPGFVDTNERAYQYVGSYKDTSNRALRFGPKKYGYTVESCALACNGFKLFALQANGWCVCDNDFNHATKYGSSSIDCAPLGKGWCNALYIFSDTLGDVVVPPFVCDAGFPGVHAYVWGDPHFRMFNGKSTNFQGSPGFYYYMIPCFGSDNNKMPFNMIGKHHPWGKRKPQLTTLEYISLELFDNANNQRYILYLSQNWLGYSDGPDFTYDYYVAKHKGLIKTLSLGVTVFGSITIKATYAKPWYKFSIDFDDDVTKCLGTDLKFKFRGTHKLRSGLWVVHAMFVEPPMCDKCETCGLLGSFKYNDYTFAKCDGSTKVISSKYTYNEEHLGCRAPTIPSPFEPENDPIVPNAYCDTPANALKVLNECKRITNLNSECCQANIGGCDDFPTNCKVDVCEDLETIPDATFQTNVIPLVQEVLGDLLRDICDDDGIIPVFRPTSRPTGRPTDRPSDRPTLRPTLRPTSRPVTTWWSASNAHGSSNNVINNDDISEQEIIDEIEEDLSSSNKTGLLSNEYVNMFIGGILLIAVFTVGIVLGSSQCNIKSKPKHIYSSINGNSSTSEYTTDDAIIDENPKINVQ